MISLLQFLIVTLRVLVAAAAVAADMSEVGAALVAGGIGAYLFAAGQTLKVNHAAVLGKGSCPDGESFFNRNHVAEVSALCCNRHERLSPNMVVMVEILFLIIGITKNVNYTCDAGTCRQRICACPVLLVPSGGIVPASPGGVP